MKYNVPTSELFDTITTQHLQPQPGDDSDSNGEKSESSKILDSAKMLDKLTGLAKLRKQAERRKHWASLYLVVSAVPHSSYGSVASPTTFDEALEMLMNEEVSKSLDEDAEMVVRGHIDLIEYMKPVGPEEGTNLLDTLNNKDMNNKDMNNKNGKDHADHNDSTSNNHLVESPHWKDHLDVRMVYDRTPLTPQSIASPHLRSEYD